MDAPESFATEFEFTLPVGYVDEEGTAHRTGRMRLATASDEILPMRDPRVQQNPAYLSVILLSRVITGLGSLRTVNTRVIENLFSRDFAFLQEFYNRVNETGQATEEIQCPSCGHTFEREAISPGEL